MSFHGVTAGIDVPNDINVIIEIAANSTPVKYEVDKDTGTLKVDRMLSTAMFYPCNYGYVPQTLCDDGDPIDVMVATPFPLLNGSVIRARPIGMLAMADEAGGDNKIIAVPISKITPLYDQIRNARDLPESLLNSIEHFFKHYKDLCKGKWVDIKGWHAADAACKEILSSITMYEKMRDGTAVQQ
jgi:inorganic pyrophosphatase